MKKQQICSLNFIYLNFYFKYKCIDKNFEITIEIDCAVLGCLAQSDPFTTKPQTKYVFTGLNVSLNCGVWNDGSTMQWRTPRGLVADSIQGVYPTYQSYYDLHVPRANHYLLVILRARSNDAGRYTCSTFDATGTTAHAYADIAVLSKEFKILPPSNEGNVFSGVCLSTRGSP